MERKTKFLFALAVVLFALSFLFFLVSLNVSKKALEKQSIYASVEISDGSVGFDLNSSALTFGKVTLGSVSERKVEFVNRHDFPVNLFVTSRGNISRFFNDELMEIGSKDSVKVSIVLRVGNNEGYGKYEGFVDFESRPVIRKLFKRN